MYPQPAFTSPARGLVTADAILDGTAFERLLREWNATAGTLTPKTPFLKASWLDCWRRFAMDSESLHVLAVRDAGRLIAVAPLMRVRTNFSLADRLEFLGTGPAGADYLDVIVEDSRDDAMDAVAAAIDARALPLYLDHLPPNAQAHRLARTLLQLGWTALEDSPDVCPFVDLSGHTWDSYLASLGPSHRANVRRRIRALQGAFDVRFSLVDSECARRDALERLIEFSVDRWKRHGGTSAFPNPQMIAFHHALTQRALSEGWLRLYTLTLNGVIAAVMYGVTLDDRFYFYQHGYSSEYARYSLGLVLMALTIRAAIDSRTREFDMLYGHEAYKSLWTSQQRPLSRLQLFPPRVVGTLLRRHAQTRRALRVVARQLRRTTRHDDS